MTTVTSHHIDSAIIGFWRMGATIFEIAAAVEIKPAQVEMIINTYKSN
jgi:hypothetical protein